jgi:hypothetical protein
MRKVGLHWVTAVHNNLTHLIFVQPHPSKVDLAASNALAGLTSGSAILEQRLVDAKNCK